MQKSGEAELVVRLNNRDRQAFEELLDRYEGSVYRFFYFANPNHSDAQDRCGETFFRFTRAILQGRIKRVVNLKAYLFGIARHVLHETYRKKGPVFETVLLEEKVGRQSSVFEQVSSRDDIARACRIINHLDTPEREILLFRFLEGLSYQEISGIMEMPVNSVKSIVHRGRKKICWAMSRKESSSLETKNG